MTVRGRAGPKGARMEAFVQAALLDNLLGLLKGDDRRLLRRIATATAAMPHDARLAALAARLPALMRLSDGARLAPGIDADALIAAIDRLDGAGPGNPVAAIRHLLMQAREDEAAELLAREGGAFFIHYHGPDAVLDILNRFSPQAVARHEVLTLARAMYGLKSGQVGHAGHIIAARFGADMATLDAALAAGPALSLQARVFRLVMTLYEDGTAPATRQQPLFDLVAEFAVDDHLHRGVFYNALLGHFVQQQQFDLAEDVAVRADQHYRAAGCHLLVFYIDIHRALLSLRRGDVAVAEAALREAARSLAQVGFDAPADHRLLGLLCAITALERGDASALTGFITEEFEHFAYGEIWPSLAETALTYCSRVLAGQIGIGAALTFLGKWRIQQWRSRRFNTQLALREADILQSAGRWQAAADRLATIQSRINLTWIETAHEALTTLADPVEIELTLAWLRHLIQHVPARPLLARQVAALLRNDHIGPRERGRLMLWAAWLARRARDMDGARRAFAQTLEDAGRRGMVTHLTGDLPLVEALLADRRIADHIRASGPLGAVLRRIERHAERGRNRTTPLTGQEMRVLRLIADGSGNKHAARQLRLSEVTVKFHLTNLYRKMGVAGRKEAVASARALGWIA